VREGQLDVLKARRQRGLARADDPTMFAVHGWGYLDQRVPGQAILLFLFQPPIEFPETAFNSMGNPLGFAFLER
jgi:hypothetical protein